MGGAGGPFACQGRLRAVWEAVKDPELDQEQPRCFATCFFLPFVFSVQPAGDQFLAADDSRVCQKYLKTHRDTLSPILTFLDELVICHLLPFIYRLSQS